MDSMSWPGLDRDLYLRVFLKLLRSTHVRVHINLPGAYENAAVATGKKDNVFIRFYDLR